MSRSPSGWAAGPVPPSAPAWLAYAALLAIGCNLRSPLTALPPVLDTIRAQLGLSAPMAGMLTSIPVLCFGLLPPLLSPLIRRLGVDRSLYAALIGSALGMTMRPFLPAVGFFAGTLLIGVSLALGNIAALLAIARDFARQVNLATGVFTAAMNIGAMLTIGLTVPLARALGWRMALASWSVLTIAAMAVWWAKRRAEGAGTATPAPSRHADTPSGEAPSLLRRPVVWLMAVAFAIHISCYYALTAWLPAYLVDSGTMDAPGAGFVASSFQVFSLTGALGLPLLARRASLGTLLVVAGAAWTVTPVWLMLAPQQWYLWSPIGSFAHGGTFVLVFMLIMEHAQNLDDNRRISTLVQSAGYCLAATGPVLMGWLHRQSGGWTQGFVLLATLTFLLVPIGLLMRKMSPRRPALAPAA
ncbi:MAG TPA: MFS transporter [Novosphingobium sp.]|nr:MFS transporter [Novosphingobium sp.]